MYEDKIRIMWTEVRIKDVRKNVIRMLWEFWPEDAERLQRPLVRKGYKLPSCSQEEQQLDLVVTLHMLKLNEYILTAGLEFDPVFAWRTYKKLAKMFQCQRSVNLCDHHKWFFTIAKAVKHALARRLYRNWRDIKVYQELSRLTYNEYFHMRIQRSDGFPLIDDVYLIRDPGNVVWRLGSNYIEETGCRWRSTDFLDDSAFIDEIEVLTPNDAENKLWFRIKWHKQNSRKVYSAVRLADKDCKFASDGTIPVFDRIYEHSREFIAAGPCSCDAMKFRIFTMKEIGKDDYIQGDLDLHRWSYEPRQFNRRDYYELGVDNRTTYWVSRSANWIPTIDLWKFYFEHHKIENDPEDYEFHITADQYLMLSVYVPLEITHHQHRSLQIPVGDYFVMRLKSKPVNPARARWAE